MRQTILEDDELYLGDNGRARCGKHSGASARFSGRDISGHNVMRVTQRMAIREKVTIRCEQPSCDVVRGMVCITKASTELRAAIWCVDPCATQWTYATPERVGVLIDQPNGSKRLIDGDELNRVYALMADAEPGTIIADAIARAQVAS